MKKINVALLIAIMAVFLFGCGKPPGKVVSQYEMGSTSFYRLLTNPSRTRISTNTAEDVIVLEHHKVVSGKKVLLLFFDNDDRYVCLSGEKNCWKTPDSNGFSPENIPNTYMKSGK